MTMTVAPRTDAQTVRGMVVGIDQYTELQDLRGAVNDARDVARALVGIGVRDLVVLEDGAATRSRIEREWKDLVNRAAPGETLVLTYAGHGGQEPERVPGTERDGRDEVLLLGGFRSQGAGTRERIFDDEINQWFLEAGERDLRVVFVADSCHSGTLTRSVDPRAPRPSYRTAPYTITDDMLDLAPPVAAAALDEADLHHVSFLAAGQEYEQVPEIVLSDDRSPPAPRGALSYMFARALEGAADIDGDGVLRRHELWRYVRENVRMASEARQTPNLMPNARGGEVVLRLSRSDTPAIAKLTAVGDGPDLTTGRPGSIRLTVLNAGPGVLDAVRGTLTDVRLVPETQLPDLIWDAQRRQAITGLGDVVAYDAGLAALPAVIDKWRAVRAVQALSARASLRLRLYPNDGAHRAGTVIEVEIDDLHTTHLTLIGLSGSGVVHYLYPLPSDPPEIAPGEPFRLGLEVTPPFGADHVVAASAEHSLAALNDGLRRLDGRRDAPQAAALMAETATRAGGWRSGVLGLYTIP